MKNLILLLSGLLLAFFTNAQNDAMDVNNVQRSLGAAGTYGVGPTPTSMRSLPIKEEAMKGDFYLNKEYKEMIVKVLDDDNYQLLSKYNVQNNVFVVKRGEDLGSLDGKLVEQFTYNDGIKDLNFISSGKYPFNPMEASPGFYELLYADEDVQLLSRAKIQIVDANYNVALDVGDRAGRIEIIKRYYLYQKGMFSEIKNFKKKNLAMFGKLSTQVQNYIRDENLSANNENDLIDLVKRYDFMLESAAGNNSQAD
ncbi:MAG: hypothetical protein RJQ09_10105 [Cyclobacteriaceae bacterium]